MERKLAGPLAFCLPVRYLEVVTWIRRNLLAFVVLLAVAVSFLVGRYDSADRASKVQAAGISICIDESGRAALVAAYKHRTAIAQKRQGNDADAADYEAFSRGGLRLIPLAPEDQEDREHIGDVKPYDPPRGERVYILTDQAQRLIERGCRAAWD